MKSVLDAKGAVLALFFGAVLFLYGGLPYLALMLVFFFLAILVTRYEYELKRELGLYEHERGWENVLSNGFLPTILAVLSPLIGPMPFIASMAAVTADKFGSEIGVLDPHDPLSIFSLKPVKPGTSGGMSIIGTVGSLSGGCVIGAAAALIFGINPTAALLVGFVGLAGSIADTAFGVLEEAGIGTKGTTNFICSLTGALFGLYLIR
ncbi:DUF92 domain-containing protein [Candidatus Micrarchaeota archaeon]|nr:DUF92 domain-containing protein [Candidatus Micrarchaeota archaeon]